MDIFLGSFRAVIWFILCVVMALGMLTFAIIYGVFSFTMKRFAWKDVSFSLPSLKFAK